MPESSEKEQQRYQLTVTDTQAQTLADACELLARLHMGQLAVVGDLLLWQRKDTENVNHLKEELRALEPLATGLEPNASWGIMSPEIHDRARVAWEIYQVVRNRLAWDRHPEGGSGVAFDAPMKASKEEEMPRMERREEDS